MISEQERLERAKMKLLHMNRKVQHARNLSKKHPPLPPLGDPPSDPKPIANTYIFELTESMLADGFSEGEVARYAELVERDSRCSELELDQRELAVQAELKKVARAIVRIKDPKPRSARDRAPSVVELSESAVPDGSRYADIHQPRNEKQPTPVAKKAAPIQKKKKNADVETPGVRATGAGAKFLADLIGDGDGDGDGGDIF
jgi:hypothetical protein